MAQRKYEDDIPLEVKKERLQEVIDLQRTHSLESNSRCIGKTFEVLVEGPSKKSEDNFCGRNSENTMIVFAKENVKKGQYVNVLIEDCTAATLKGKIV